MNMEQVASVQRAMEEGVAEIKRVEQEYRKVVVNKQKMQEQKSENEMVMQEFGMLGDDANVFKLVGPILAKQGLGECKENVEKRLEFINKEVVRLDALETAFQAKITEKTAEIKKMQSDFQRVAMAAQQAAQQQQAAAPQQ